MTVVPIQGSKREYLWYVRDGYFVRSPVSVDGVAVSPEERERAEKKWIERQKKRERERSPDRENFLGFKFEAGNYFFAGRKVFEGHELVAVEYYPEEGFADDDKEDAKSEEDAEIEAKLNKVLLVTMLIDADAHQIVRMTLDNTGFDFLPGRWLVQLDTVEASMVMHKPFEDVWLPRDISTLTAGFRFDVRGRWSDVDFDALDERFATLGAGIAFDTRRDPTIPGNAVYLALNWRRLFFLGGSAQVDANQTTLDLRGYKRLWGQALLASQFYWTFAGGPLPPYEQPFIGGGQTLRGYEAGRFLGDNASLAAVELRLPLTSPLSFARGGIHVFYDTGAVYDDGESLGGARFHHAVGTGVFFRVAIIGVRTDVGWDLEGSTRFHIASSVKF